MNTFAASYWPTYSVSTACNNIMLSWRLSKGAEPIEVAERPEAVTRATKTAKD